jgi:hypothetical protein
MDTVSLLFRNDRDYGEALQTTPKRRSFMTAIQMGKDNSAILKRI